MEGRDKAMALDDERIQATIYRLHLRIQDRFPESSLGNVCLKVYDLESLTTGLSRKIWQKIMILQPPTTTASGNASHSG